MASCLAELHLWSTKSSLKVKDTDIGTYQYYDKGEPANPLEHHYYNEKLHFSEARGYSWTPKNQRPQKLRDSLKELEELLQIHTCVCIRWRTKKCCQVMLSSGVLVTLTLNGAQLEQVCVERTLVGRLPANTVTDAVLSDRLILLSFLEQSQVAAVYLSQKNQESPETSRCSDKLSPSEIKVVCVDPSAQGRKLCRHVGLNHRQDVAVCWWNLVEPDEELWPWTHTDVQRRNLVLLSCSATDELKVLSFIRTEGSPMDCRFSLLQPYHLLTVELPAGDQGHREEFWVDTCVYECGRDRLHRLSVTRVPLPSIPVSCSRHPSETALLLGLSDSSLILYDQRRGVSLPASCPVLPKLVAWHPAGAMVLIGGGQGELMCFDVGLAPINMALVAEEIAPAPMLRLMEHLRGCEGIERLQWGTSPEGGPGGTQILLLVFHGGPLAALRFRLGVLSGGHIGHGELLQQRLRFSQIQEALGILEAMDWSSMGGECFRGLSFIANHLLRLELNAEREALLEAVLGVFYAPAAPLCDQVILHYGEPVSKYARRFFHHLLRYQRFEKAFLLAVDLEDKDLFMDLHYVAGDKGEVVLADVAKRKANEIEARAITGSEALQRGKNGVLCGFGMETQVERGTPTTYTEGRAKERRVPEQRVTPRSDVLKTLTQTGSIEGGRDDGKADEDPGTLHLVHLGMAL